MKIKDVISELETNAARRKDEIDKLETNANRRAEWSEFLQDEICQRLRDAGAMRIRVTLQSLLSMEFVFIINVEDIEDDFSIACAGSLHHASNVVVNYKFHKTILQHFGNLMVANNLCIKSIEACWVS